MLLTVIDLYTRKMPAAEREELKTIALVLAYKALEKQQISEEDYEKWVKAIFKIKGKSS